MPMGRSTGSNPLYAGASIKELSRIFKVQPNTVRDRVATVKPSGLRNSVEVYDIGEAARYLTEATESEADQVSRILRLHHTDLPKLLSKEYWAGQTSKQRYEIVAGDLWPTTKVVEWLSETFKTLRLSLTLMADAVERNEELSEAQRRIIVSAVDATLNDAADRLVNAFKNKRELEIGGPPPSEENDGDDEL